MKVVPYTPEELQRVLASEPLGLIKHHICDWCGGPMSLTQPKSAYICHRCWANRVQIRAAIAAIDCVAHSSDPAHNDASSDCSADRPVQGWSS